MLISHLALSAMVFVLSEWICEKRIFRIVNKKFVFYVVIFTIIFVQILVTTQHAKGYKRFFKRSKLSHYINEQESQVNLAVKGRVAGTHLKNIIQYLNAQPDGNQAVLANGLEISRMIYFETNAKQPVSGIPILTFKYNQNNINQNSLENINSSGDQPLFIASRLSPSNSKFYIYMLMKEQLRKTIQEKNVKYIILSSQQSIYNKYFSASNMYEMVYSSGHKGKPKESYRLYRVNAQLEADDVPLYVSSSIKRSMKYFKRKRPKKYEYFETILLQDFVGLTNDDIGNF